MATRGGLSPRTAPDPFMFRFFPGAIARGRCQMEHELYFRALLVALYALFHSIRIYFGLKVVRSGGKLFSRKDDEAR